MFCRVAQTLIATLLPSTVGCICCTMPKFTYEELHLPEDVKDACGVQRMFVVRSQWGDCEPRATDIILERDGKAVAFSIASADLGEYQVAVVGPDDPFPRDKWGLGIEMNFRPVQSKVLYKGLAYPDANDLPN